MIDRVEITDVNVRIFRGNENLPDGTTLVSESQDSLHLLLFRRHSTVRRPPEHAAIFNYENIDQIKIRKDSEVRIDPFFCTCCVPGRFLEAISFLQLFPDDHVDQKRVAQDISTHVLSCYSFDTPKSYHDIPKLLIMVEFHVILAVSDDAIFSKLCMSAQVRNISCDHLRRQVHQNGCLMVEYLDKLKILKEDLGLSKVEAAIKMPFYNGNNIRDEDICAICLEQISAGSPIAETPCSPVFHKVCVFKWLPGRGTCPLCRSICTTFV